MAAYGEFDIRVRYHNDSTSTSPPSTSWAHFGECLLQEHYSDSINSKYPLNPAVWPDGSYVGAEMRQTIDGDKIIIDLDLHPPTHSRVAQQRILLGHSDDCPARIINLKSNEALKLKLEQNQNIRVAVCVMVVHGSKVLLERRASHMRTFPLRWVFPGGHVDKGETLEEAGIREVWEEVGLRVKNLRPFAMWESCYPTYLDQGVLKRQHLVVYYQAELEEPFASTFPCYPSSLQPKDSSTIKIQSSELDMVAWLELSDLARLDDIALSRRDFEMRTKEQMVSQGQEEGLSMGSEFALFAHRLLNKDDDRKIMISNL